ncbi:MAG: type II CAAX endopeptidase family protein [Bacteroidota bacterium]|nr:type II CAAX endopeptidase family protein [Bacteroidota bacterium]MDP4258248.1 type II CAAX endopeptidase family protein [Bacteroidota bacterium]
MNEILAIPSIRRQLGLLIFLVLCGFVLANLVAVPFFLFSGDASTATGAVAPKSHLSTGMLKIVQTVFTICLFLLPALFFARFVFRGKPLRHLGFRAPANNLFFFLAIITLLLSFPIDEWLGQLNRSIPLTNWMVERQQEADKQIADFLQVSSTSDILVNLFVVALLPAVCEEALFRGALQPIMIRSTRSPWTGILITAFIFSACHLQFQGFLPRMALGILLGAIYWYSGSLWVSIAAHFITNAVQVLALLYYPKYVTQEPYIPIPLAIGSLVLVIVLLMVIRRQSTAKYPPEPYAKEFQ